MTQADLLVLLKANLNILYSDSTLTLQLTQMLAAAQNFIQREGIVLQEPFSTEDGQLIVMYAEYLYRKRATNEPMPRMLRWTLNNRLMSQKAGGSSAS